MKDVDFIKAEQERSFSNLATSLGLTQQELVESIKAARIVALENRMAVTKDSPIAEIDNKLADLDTIRKIDSVNGLIELIRYYNKSYQEVVIATASELFPAFEKAGLFHKEVVSSANLVENDILVFLQSIPIVTLFENDGGPYVTKLNSEGIIYVVRNEHMDLLLEYLITPIVINSIAFQSKEQAETFRDNYSFDKLSKLYFTIARINRENKIWTFREEFLFALDPLFERGFTVQYYGMILYWSMQYFINFHEYAHVLCNHFSSGKDSISKEIEADNFAINALYYNILKQLKIEEKDIDDKMVNDKLIFMVTSPFWLFLFFSVNNIERGLTINSTHPHPLLRLDNAKRTLDLLTKDCVPLSKKISQIFNFIDCILNEIFKDLSEVQLQSICRAEHYTKSPLFIYNSKSKSVDVYDVTKKKPINI